MGKRLNEFFIWTLTGLLVVLAHPRVAFSDEHTFRSQPVIILEEEQPRTAASERLFPKFELQARPNLFLDQILELTPGLVVVQHAGGGKANQYYLRGFDADHGTDIAFYVDGIPINAVSHGHGQGYTDLHFVIPELVDALLVRKGPYFAPDGDFATAGAVELKLAEGITENQLSFQGGRFDTFRGLGILGYQGETGGTYLALEALGSNGPFENPDQLKRLNIMARGNFTSGNWRGVITGMLYRSDWNASGQIPAPLVDSGVLDRFGSLDPTEGGSTDRYQVSANLQWNHPSGQSLEILPYFYHYDFNLYSNFTFFLNDPVNGDQIQQKDKREVYGLRTRYRREDKAGEIALRTEAGMGLRNDRIDNELNHTMARRFLTATTGNRINQFNPYFYAQEQAILTDWFTVVAGFRYDHIFMEVNDTLGGNLSGSANGGLISPKLSLVFSPADHIDVFVNFGRGFHSNDARGVVDPRDPASLFGKAWGGELGVELEFLEKVELTLTGFMLRLGSELVWVGDEGVTEPSGPSLRAGFEGEVRWKIFDWMWTYLDFTYTHGEFLDLPSGMDAIPLAPRWTLNGGISAKHPSGFFGTLQVEAISDRPANEDDSLTAEGFMVWNLSAGYEKRPQRAWSGQVGYAFQVDILNLFNANYRTAQFDTTSRPFPGGAEINAIHFTPGWPITVLGSASLFF